MLPSLLSPPVAPWDLVIQQEVSGALDCDFQGVEHSQGSSCHHQLKTVIAIGSSGNLTRWGIGPQQRVPAVLSGQN